MIGLFEFLVIGLIGLVIFAATRQSRRASSGGEADEAAKNRQGRNKRSQEK